MQIVVGGHVEGDVGQDDSVLCQAEEAVDVGVAVFDVPPVQDRQGQQGRQGGTEHAVA